MMCTRTIVSLGLTSVMLFQAAGAGQTAQAQAPRPGPALKILVLEGANAANSITLGHSIAPVVEVRDQNDFPLEGATVTFILPESGPGGSFPGNRKILVTKSDLQGQAAAQFILGATPGMFKIRVTAVAGDRQGEVEITQTNTQSGFIGYMPPKKPFMKRWTTWAIIGGAVGAGIATWLLVRDDSGSATTITINPGSVVIGGPR